MKLEHPERFNIPLAEKTLDHVVRHPDLHDQDTVGGYTCNSPGCIAGWVRFFSGAGKEERSIGTEVLTQDKLSITQDEFEEFFGETDEATAIEIFADYIVQAKAAQAEPVYELSAADRAALDEHQEVLA